MPKAVVLLSGGLDSTTCLAQAIADGCDVTAISFRYGQRHTRELTSAQNVCDFYNVDHVVIDLDLSVQVRPHQEGHRRPDGQGG